MLKVGLTGNFGSGHQEILKIFQDAGTPIFDADLVIKWILNHDKESIQELKRAYGDSVYSYGVINLLKFDSNKKFEKLLDVISPKLFEIYENFRLRKNKFAYTLFVSSVLFEKEWNEKMNYTIHIFKPQITRKKDLIKKSSMDISMVEFILENEMCEFVKNAEANFIIANYAENSKDEKIIKQINQIHSNLIRNCQNLNFIKTF